MVFHDGYSRNTMRIINGHEIFPNLKILILIYKKGINMRENWEDYPIQDLNEYELDMDSLLNLTSFNRKFVFSLNTLDNNLEYYNFKLTR